jgi:hypothetical protein
MLVSTNAATAGDVVLSAEPVRCGRGDADAIRLKDERVLNVQFEVRCMARLAEGCCPRYELEDHSHNGTLVNKRLVKASTVQLQDRDLIEVLPASIVGRHRSPKPAARDQDPQDLGLEFSVVCKWAQGRQAGQEAGMQDAGQAGQGSRAGKDDHGNRPIDRSKNEQTAQKKGYKCPRETTNQPMRGAVENRCRLQWRDVRT